MNRSGSHKHKSNTHAAILLKKYGDDTKDFKFEIQRKGQNVMFLVDDEETIEMDGIFEVRSNRIGLMVSGEHEVSFDNAKIIQ